MAASIVGRVCFQSAGLLRLNCLKECRPIFTVCRHIHRSYFLASSLDTDFHSAKEILNKLTEDPGNETKLQIYALFKQATEGKNIKKKPGFTDFVGKVKWEAWNSLADLSSDDAKKQYIDLIKNLAGTEAEVQPTDNIDSKYQQLLVSIENNQFRITLNRPSKKNAITYQMYEEWGQALDEAANDKTAITVVTGAGDYYCSGNDLSNFSNISPANMQQKAEEGGRILEKFIKTFIDHPKPLIGVINGPAVGISVTALGLFDAVFATDVATFHTPFTALGQSPEGCSSYIFPKIMGSAKANQLLLFNEKITAHEACSLGLVTEVFQHDTFHNEVEKRLTKIASYPKQSMKYSKMLCRDVERELLHKINRAECARLVERWQSDECFKAIMDFMQMKK